MGWTIWDRKTGRAASRRVYRSYYNAARYAEIMNEGEPDRYFVKEL